MDICGTYGLLMSLALRSVVGYLRHLGSSDVIFLAFCCWKFMSLMVICCNFSCFLLLDIYGTLRFAEDGSVFEDTAKQPSDVVS